MRSAHHCHDGPEERNRYLKIGLISAVTSIAEISASVTTGSIALGTDALHNSVDGIEGFMNAFIAHRARFLVDSTRLRQFGFGLSLVLIGISSILMLLEARERLASDELAAFPGWTIVIASGALAMNLWQFSIHRKAPGHDHNDTYRGQMLHLMLDIGGSVAAIVGTALVVLGGIAKADAWTSVVIIGVIWYRIFRGYREVFLEKPSPNAHWKHHH